MCFSVTLHFDRFASTGDAHNWRTANASCRSNHAVLIQVHLDARRGCSPATRSRIQIVEQSVRRFSSPRKVARIQCSFSSQSFWKAGSARKGSPFPQLVQLY
jgi:hypothetical protein